MEAFNSKLVILLLFSFTYSSVVLGAQEINLGDTINPTVLNSNGNCPNQSSSSKYVHNDINGDGLEQNGECWRGLVIKDGKVGVGTVNPGKAA